MSDRPLRFRRGRTQRPIHLPPPGKGVVRCSGEVLPSRGGTSVIVLGVDPGTAITGFGIVRAEGDRLELVDFGSIRTEAGAAMTHRLRDIHSSINHLIAKHQPDILAVEELFFNRNVTTAIAVGQARGVVLLSAALGGLEVFEFTPPQVKQAVTGYGRADKRQVQAMIKTILGLPEVPKPDDAADALAIAICAANSRLRAALGVAVPAELNAATPKRRLGTRGVRRK